MASAALTRSYIDRLFAFSLLFSAVAEAKFKLTTPSSAWISPFRFVVYCYFTHKLPVSRPRTSAVLSRSYIFFFRAASFFYGSNLCFTQSDDVPWLGKYSFASQARSQVTKCRAPLWQVSRSHGRPRATGRPRDRGTNRNYRERRFRVAHV